MVAKSMSDVPNRCPVPMWVPRRALVLGLLVLALVLAVPCPPASHPGTLTASAPSAFVGLAADRGFVGRGDGLNLTLWLNVTGNGQVETTWVNLTFNTASAPSQNGLFQGPGAWTQPSACTTLLASGWYLQWRCSSLPAGSYLWRIPAYAPGNGTVGRNQTVSASSRATTGTSVAETAANTTVWIAGALVRIDSVGSEPAESASGGQIVTYWVNASNDPALRVPPNANGTDVAHDVTIRITLDTGLRPGQGLVNLTTTWAVLPPGTNLSVSILAIVSEDLTAGSAVGIRVTLSYRDFNGHVIGPIEAQSSPLYVVKANALALQNLIAGAAIALIAILATLVVLLYLGQRKIVLDEVFFMTKGGALIRHVSRTPSLQRDDAMVASMFVAIQEFLRDSFAREASLDAVSFGRRRAAVVRGELTILAAVASHGDVEYLIPEMLAAIRAIEAHYWDALMAWDGSVRRLEGIDEALTRLLGGEFRSPWRVQLA
jgi:hypothetical protein